MEFRQVIESRASVRTFTDEPIPHEDINAILQAATTAPCIGGTEFWKYIVITDRILLNEIAGIVKAKYNALIPNSEDQVIANVRVAVEKFASVISAAPAVVAIVTEPYHALIDGILKNAGYTHDDMNRMRNHPDIQSVGAVVQTMLLAAVDMGYAGCWLSGPMIAEAEIAVKLDVTAPNKLATFVALGKAGEPVSPRIKAALDEIVKFI